MKESWLRHIQLLIEYKKTEIWVLIGPHGCGKTATLNGIADRLEQEGITTTRAPNPECDVWLYDDAGQKFAKRLWSSKLGKSLSVFLQIVREVFPLTIMTVPELDMLDISIRESPVLEIIRVVRPGFAIWREPIQVKPRWSNEEWRMDYARELQMLMERKD